MRRMKKIYCPKDFRIEPWDSRFYALFQGEDLICVTAYKKGAVKAMDLLYSFQISLEKLKPMGGETVTEAKNRNGCFRLKYVEPAMLDTTKEIHIDFC